MKKELIVALDVGTSSCRAVCFRPDGSRAAGASLPLMPARIEPGMSEYQAGVILQTARRVLDTVLEKVGPQSVAAIGIASQRSTVVLWNTQTGAACGPVLAWEDGRAQQQAQQAPLTQEEIHLQTGLYKTPFFSAPKMAWILQTSPAASQALKQGCLLSAPVASYLIWHLTGGQTCATDYSLAQRTLLLDIHTLQWSECLCRGFRIPDAILPQLSSSAADYGAYRFQGVSIPITACVADQQAAAVYFNILPQESLINYGTGAFWLYRAGEKPVSLPGMLTSVSATAERKKVHYLLEGPVNAAASALLWLKAQGIDFDDIETDALCQQSAHPVWFLPAFGGLGAPYWDFMVPTAVEGLSPLTRKADWVAGVVRAIAFLLADIAHYLQTNGQELKGPVRASGGLSRVNYLTQFQADLLQREIDVSPETEATLCGTALLAAKPVNGKLTFLQENSKIQPKLSSHEVHTLYTQWQDFVTRLRSKKS